MLRKSKVPCRRLFSSIAQQLPEDVPTSARILGQRHILAVNGKDASKFLNGLLTVRPPDNPVDSSPIGSYAGLLNSKGRVVADMFVYSAHSENWVHKHLEDPSPGLIYLLDVDKTVSDRVMQMLSFYKLASDVSIQHVSTLQSFISWDDAADPDLPGSTITAAVPNSLHFPDFRVPGLGYRTIAEEGALEPTVASATPYELRRYLFGVPEGAKEFVPEKTLPLEYCMDYMNGVDFHKGCYVGQELTIRTKHHGVIRKRVVPVVLSRPGEEIPESIYAPTQFDISAGQGITDATGSESDPAPVELPQLSPFGQKSRPVKRPAGNIVAALGNVGLATLRIDKLGHRFEVDSGVVVTPLTPYWWPESPDLPN